MLGAMNERIIEALNLEIARLTEARNLIGGTQLTSRTTGARHRRAMSDATKKKMVDIFLL